MFFLVFIYLYKNRQLLHIILCEYWYGTLSNTEADSPYLELSAPADEHTYDRPDSVHYDKVKYENTKKLVGGGESSQETTEPTYEKVS